MPKRISERETTRRQLKTAPSKAVAVAEKANKTSKVGSGRKATPVRTRISLSQLLPGQLFASLLALFFATRLANLTIHGMYYDEATYIYWGKVIGSDWNQRFMGAVAGGKQPLHSWLVMLSEGILDDPVVAGRMASVFTGCLTLIALWLLSKRLFSTRVAILAAVLYIFVPFTLIYDRTTMIDSLLAAEYIWMLYLAVRLVDRREAMSVAGLAVSFGAALLTKSVAWYFPPLLPFALLIAWPRKNLTRQLIGRWLVTVLVGLGLGWVIYYISFGSSPASESIGQFEREFGKYTMPLSTLVTFPWQTWGGNIVFAAKTFSELVTIPLSLAAVGAVTLSRWLGPKALMLTAWVVLPIAGMAAIAAIYFDRYLLFAIPPLLILIARMVERLGEWLSSRISLPSKVFLGHPQSNAVAVALSVLLLIAPVLQDFGILTDPRTANRFIGGYYGLWPARDYLVEQAKKGPVIVIADYLPAPVEDGMEALLWRNPNIKVLRLVPLGDGRLAIGDVYTGQGYPKGFHQGKDVYYIHKQGAETDSWLAGYITRVKDFSNLLDDGSYVGLYRIQFDRLG